MQAEIIKIEPKKNSRNLGEKFIRIHFKYQKGKKRKWAKMDLVPSFRNFGRWKNLLRVGNIVANLQMMDRFTINADSFPVLRQRPDLAFEDERLMEFSKTFL